MKTHLQSLLRELESSEKITVLYANQYGNRAWGVAATDAAWEGQFIYIRPEASYLEVKDRRNPGPLTIQDESLSLLGMDVRSFLEGYLRSEISALEALHAPEVYRRSKYFPATLWALLPAYFSPSQVIRQYVALSESFRPKSNTKTVSVQAYLSALRPMLAATWVAAHKHVPPLSLQALYQPLEAHPALQKEIRELWLVLQEKGAKARAPRPVLIEQYLKAETKRLEQLAASLPTVKGSAQKLTDFFRYLLTLTPKDHQIRHTS
ncbi:MAG: nucleotidyltransferase domain-containing protein [Bacteroidota bacterium]